MYTLSVVATGGVYKVQGQSRSKLSDSPLLDLSILCKHSNEQRKILDTSHYIDLDNLIRDITQSNSTYTSTQLEQSTQDFEFPHSHLESSLKVQGLLSSSPQALCMHKARNNNVASEHHCTGQKPQSIASGSSSVTHGPRTYMKVVCIRFALWEQGQSHSFQYHTCTVALSEDSLQLLALFSAELGDTKASSCTNPTFISENLTTDSQQSNTLRQLRYARLSLGPGEAHLRRGDSRKRALCRLSLLTEIEFQEGT